MFCGQKTFCCQYMKSIPFESETVADVTGWWNIIAKIAKLEEQTHLMKQKQEE